MWRRYVRHHGDRFSYLGPRRFGDTPTQRKSVPKTFVLVMTTRQWIALLIGLVFSWTALLASASDRDFAVASHAEGDRLFNSGQHSAAIRHYESAISTYEKLGLSNDLARGRHQLGFAHWHLRELDRALVYFETNQAFHDRRGDSISSGNYLQYIAQVLIEKADYDAALAHLERARALLAAKPERIAEIDHWRAVGHERAGELDEAREILVQAQESTSQELWDRYLAQDAQRVQLFKVASSKRSIAELAFAVLAGIAIGVLLPLLAKSEIFRHWFKNGLLVFFSLGVTVVLAEAVLRAFIPGSPTVSHLLHTPNQVTRFSPTPGVMPGVDYVQTRFSINNAGLRGEVVPEDTGVPRIVAIGGSSTEALFLDDPDAWPSVLQTLLTQALSKPVWVGNAGKSGLNSFSHVVQFYHYKDELAPDIVIVQSGINDLNQCISGGINAIRDNARFIKQPGFYESYKMNVFQEIRPTDSRSSWRLVDTYRQALRSIDASAASAASVPFDYVVQDQAALFYNEQRRRRNAARKEAAAPDISECLEAFRYNLDLIANMADDVGIRVVFLTQGSLYRDDLTAEEEYLLWFGSMGSNPFAEKPPDVYYSAAVMGELLQRYNQQTLAVCQSHSVSCLDVDRALPKTTATYYDDVHLNVSGSKALAQALSELLLSTRALLH